MMFDLKHASNKYTNAVLLLQMLIERDLQTAKHSMDVAFLMKALVPEYINLGIDPDDCFWAALMHDIGKIMMPDYMFSNRIIQSKEEWEVIKKHTEYTKLILENIDFPKHIVLTAFAHHERCDGSGYPLGLKKESIPVAARMLAIIDSFCAIIEERPYRKARSLYEAIRILNSSAKSYDRELLPKFIKYVEMALYGASTGIDEFKGILQR